MLRRKGQREIQRRYGGMKRERERDDAIHLCRSPPSEGSRFQESQSVVSNHIICYLRGKRSGSYSENSQTGDL